MASQMTTEDSQQALLNIAEQYEELARLAEKEEKRAELLKGSWASPLAIEWRSGRNCLAPHI